MNLNSVKYDRFGKKVNQLKAKSSVVLEKKILYIRENLYDPYIEKEAAWRHKWLHSQLYSAKEVTGIENATGYFLILVKSQETPRYTFTDDVLKFIGDLRSHNPNISVMIFKDNIRVLEEKVDDFIDDFMVEIPEAVIVDALRNSDFYGSSDNNKGPKYRNLY